MLKEAFGVLKSVSASSSNAHDEIKSFLSFVENKMRKYNEPTKNIVQQAICELIFKADTGYYDQNHFGNYYPYGICNPSTHAVYQPIPQSNQSIPISQPSQPPLSTDTTSNSQQASAAHPVYSSLQMPTSTPTPPLASPSQHSSCSEVSNDYDVNEYI